MNATALLMGGQGQALSLLLTVYAYGITAYREGRPLCWGRFLLIPKRGVGKLDGIA